MADIKQVSTYVPLTPIPKARRTLCIVPHARNPRASTTFFSLPREVRDIIYRHALVEPALWFRRHTLGCPFRVLTAGNERPVFTCTKDRARYQSRLHRHDAPCLCRACDRVDDSKLKVCRTLCQGRPGQGLLRTCWHVYVEADPIFWENMLCFGDSGMFVSTLKRLPQSALVKIRRVSLLEKYERYWWGGLRRTVRSPQDEQAAQILLSRMQNLVELELSPSEFSHGDFSYIRQLSSLQILRSTVLEPIILGQTEGPFPWIWVRVAKALIPGSCQRYWAPSHVPSTGPQLGQGSCFLCYQYSPAWLDWFYLWEDHSMIGGTASVLDVVLDRLRGHFRGRLIPAHRGPNAAPVAARLVPEGMEVGIIGLPVKSPKERKGLQILKERDRMPAKQCHNTVRLAQLARDDTEAEDIETKIESRVPKHPARKNFVKKVELVERDFAEVALVRQQRMLDFERQEVMRARRAQKRVVKSMKELDLAKRIGRKRVNH